MSKRAKFRVYIAYWYDGADHLFRVAGIYDSSRKAERRLKELPGGTTQTLTMNEPVRFIFESARPEKGERV